MGYLLDLIHVEHQVSLIQALARFWEISTATIQFGEHELTPTLEKYQAAIRIDFKPRVIELPVGFNPTSILAEFLNLETYKIEKLIKLNTSRFYYPF